MSDKITLDVGGTTFVTSKGTLSSGSTYFASLFSKEWNADANDESVSKRQKLEETQPTYFLDQNPETFAIILEFLRVRCIDVKDLQDVKVLILAEFLGIDPLLKAVKVKTYLNIQAGFEGSDEEAIEAFENKVGSIREAIRQGYLPKCLTEQKNPENFREYAVLTVYGIENSMDAVTITAKETRDLPVEERFSFLQTLNWLHCHGYTKQKEGMDWRYRYGDQLAFYRDKNPKRPESKLWDHVIIDAHHKEEMAPQQKIFALLVSDRSADSIEDTMVFYGLGRDENVANQEPDIDRSDFQNTRWGVGKYVDSNKVLAWIEARGFTCREKDLELRFKTHFNELLQFAYLSETDPEYQQLQVYSKRL